MPLEVSVFSTLKSEKPIYEKNIQILNTHSAKEVPGSGI